MEIVFAVKFLNDSGFVPVIGIVHTIEQGRDTQTLLNIRKVIIVALMLHVVSLVRATLASSVVDLILKVLLHIEHFILFC